MAGHSQFHNIMHRKGAQDAKRAKMFAKLAREITVATKLGGSDSNSNPRLRTALSTARENNMPKDNIERAIAKAQGPGDGSNYEDIRYEGYGPGGVAIIVEALTDNRNRTASEVRSAFTKFAGNLGESGSVSFSFSKNGHIVYNKSIGSFDSILEYAIEVGAENVEEFDEFIEIITSVESFSNIREEFNKKYGDSIESGLIWIPNLYVELQEPAKTTLMKLIDALEDNDDVQKVFHNLEEKQYR